MAEKFLPVPTYADPVLTGIDKKTGKERSAFNPVWLAWFLQLTNGQTLGGITNHNDLSGLQGGAVGQFYHLSVTELNAIPFRDLSVPFAIGVGASPFIYQNGNVYDMDVLVIGGAGLTVQYSRDGVTYYTVGNPNSMIALSPGDYVNIIYGGAPTLVGIPR